MASIPIIADAMSRASAGQPTSQVNYPRNCWWVAAASTEVGTEPLARWILGDPVVLYRKQDGQVAALENRCVHRWVPLSSGRVCGDDIVCGYHGFRYDASGRCVHVPSQEFISPKIRVRSYPVVERAPYVWIWTGDEARRAEVPEPEALDWVDDPDWVVAQGSYVLHANYLALKENVLDLTHFGYVHADTFKILDYERAPTVRVEGHRVYYRQEFPDLALPAMYGEPTGIGTSKPVTRINSGSFVSPAMQEASVVIADPAPAPGARQRFDIKVVHMTTPESPTRTRYWWARGQDFGQRAGAAEQVQRLFEEAFLQDKVILEAMQSIVDGDRRHHEAPEVSVKADEAGVRMRRIVNEMLSRES